MRPLPQQFYLQPTRRVARELLGKFLLVRQRGKTRRLMIVETEAYLGVKDRACHSFGGRKTTRVQAMYLPGGHVYIYFIYGVHFCLNVVTQVAGVPEAVLIRAVFDPHHRDPRRYSGPGKLSRELRLTRRHNGLDLTIGKELSIVAVAPKSVPLSIASGPRIGIGGAGPKAVGARLRFFIKGHPAVSG